MDKPLFSLRSRLRNSEAEEKKSAVADVIKVRCVVHPQSDRAEGAASKKLCCERNDGNTTEEQVD